MSRVTKINVDGIRKFIDATPKTAEFKPFVHILNKQLLAHEKYEADPDYASPNIQENLKRFVMESVDKIVIRMNKSKHHRAE